MITLALLLPSGTIDGVPWRVDFIEILGSPAFVRSTVGRGRLSGSKCLTCFDPCDHVGDLTLE